MRVRLELPPRVTRGARVAYVVALRNVSHDPIDLRPCGGYEQEVKGVGLGFEAVSVRGGTSSFRLNCDSDPMLQPAESRRYEMVIDVPRSLTGSEVLFRWGFVDSMPDYDGQRWVPMATS